MSKYLPYHSTVVKFVISGYNTGVNHIKSDGLLKQHRHPFSTCDRGARTMSYSTPFFPENLEDYAPWVATHGLLFPYGKCQCGCGNDAPIATKSDKSRNITGGAPTRFLPNHNRRLTPVGGIPRWVAQYGLLQPYGKCQCGCGQDAPIASSSQIGNGWNAGCHTRFVSGHNNCLRRRPIEERFWEKVNKRSPDECWNWVGSDNGFGYGQLLVEKANGKNIFKVSHRLSWEIHFGPIPDGLMVLHKCDNPPCCNPNHLFLGTQFDNMRDMVAKGRNKRGESNV